MHVGQSAQMRAHASPRSHYYCASLLDWIYAIFILITCWYKEHPTDRWCSEARSVTNHAGRRLAKQEQAKYVEHPHCSFSMRVYAENEYNRRGRFLTNLSSGFGTKVYSRFEWFQLTNFFGIIILPKWLWASKSFENSYQRVKMNKASI